MNEATILEFVKVHGISTAFLVILIIWLRTVLNQLFSLLLEKLREVMFQNDTAA